LIVRQIFFENITTNTNFGKLIAADSNRHFNLLFNY